MRGGGEMRNGLAPLPWAAADIWRDISAAKVPPEEHGVSTPCWAPGPRAPESEEEPT